MSKSHCRERYTIGANIFFVVCNRTAGHDGNHWDQAIELAWSTQEPPEEYTQRWEKS